MGRFSFRLFSSEHNLEKCNNMLTIIRPKINHIENTGVLKCFCKCIEFPRNSLVQGFQNSVTIPVPDTKLYSNDISLFLGCKALLSSRQSEALAVTMLLEKPQSIFDDLHWWPAYTPHSRSVLTQTLVFSR